MPQTLGSDIAQSSLNALLDFIGQDQSVSTDGVRRLIADCEIADLVLDRLCESFQSFLDRGMEGRKALFLLQELLDVLALGVRTFNAASERARAADLPAPEKADAMVLLGKMSRLATARHDELSSLLRWLETPRPQVDPSSLRGGRGEQQADHYVDLNELTGRLLSDEKE